MANNIEVELRGSISEEKFLEMEKVFQDEGEFRKEYKRIFIDYSTFLPGEGIKNRQRDIRLRVTNGVPEIIVKTGKFGGSEHRKELSVLAKPGEFDKLVEIFAALGFTKGVLCVRNGKVYNYKNIEFTLIEVPGYSYYFEAEKLIRDMAGRQKAKAEIKKACQELGLKLFSDNDLYEYIDTLNREVNEIFNFDDYKENYFKDRFNLKGN